MNYLEILQYFIDLLCEYDATHKYSYLSYYLQEMTEEQKKDIADLLQEAVENDRHQ